MAFLTGQAIQRVIPNKQSKRWSKSGGGGGGGPPPPDPQTYVWGVATTGTIFYGFSYLNFGTLNPVRTYGGLDISTLQVIAPSDTVSLGFDQGALLGTTTQIEMDMSPGGPVIVLVAGLSTYTVVDIPAAAYIIAADGTDIPVTLTALN